MVIQFAELAKRLTGVSTPVFGISWNPPESERKIIRDVLVFLEDRRVLYNPFAFEMERHVVDSVIKIREYLTSALQRLDGNSKAIPHLRALRAACRQYLDANQDGPGFRFKFLENLGGLRALFGVQIAYLSVEYGIDIEGELCSVIPPELKLADSEL